MGDIVTLISPCPVCGKQPDVDECGPHMRGEPPLGWYAGCYSQDPEEHFVGVNAYTRSQAITAWNAEVRTPSETKEGAK